MNDDLSRRVNYKLLKYHLRHNDTPRIWSYDEEDIPPLVKIVEDVEVLGDHDAGVTARILLSMADAVIRSGADRTPEFRFYADLVRAGEHRIKDFTESRDKGIRHRPISANNLTSQD